MDDELLKFQHETKAAIADLRSRLDETGKSVKAVQSVVEMMRGLDQVHTQELNALKARNETLDREKNELSREKNETAAEVERLRREEERKDLMIRDMRLGLKCAAVLLLGGVVVGSASYLLGRDDGIVRWGIIGTGACSLAVLLDKEEMLDRAADTVLGRFKSN